MSNGNILSACKNFNQCEEKLKEWIHPGELLGRIPLGSEDWHRLARAIKKTIQQQGAREGSRLLWISFPICMMVFLVHTGVRLYRAGEFWPAVEEVAGVPKNIAWEWGSYFVDFLHYYNLPAFEDTHGYRYITPILGHGGIPNYCLDDFFTYVLASAMEMGGVTAEEILDELSVGSGLRYQVDKPIRRFLLKGGKYALDFFERTLEMARRSEIECELPGGEELGLPDRIIQAYSRWLKERPRGKKIKRDVLHSPIIYLDPYGLGVVATLPTQQLEVVHRGISWEIRAGKNVLPVRCKAWRAGDRVRSSAEQVPLPPADDYIFRLFVDGEEYRNWYFRAQQGKPYLAFAINTGRLIRGDNLPADGVWIILQDGWDLEQDGIEITEELPPLRPQWRKYRGVALKLEEASQVGLHGPGGSSFTVFIAGHYNRPTLVGGDLLQSCGFDGVTYKGKLPALQIPRINISEVIGLDKWHLYINRESAKGKAVVSARLDKLAQHIEDSGQGWLLRLDAPGVIGSNALGIYNIIVHGPLGSDASFQITCLNGLDFIIPSTENIWPVGKTGYKPLKVTVTAPLNTELSFKNCIIGNKLEKDEKRYYDIVLQSDTIVCELEAPGLIRPITIRHTVRPLSWGWLGLDKNHCLVWENGCRTLGASNWRDCDDLQLIIKSNEIDVTYRAYLRLKNINGQVLQSEQGLLSFKRMVRFSIGKFRDTINATTWPEYELWLAILDGTHILAEFRVALIDREWCAYNVRVLPDSLQGDEIQRCVVTWDENDQVTNRIIRVWHAWRPWEEPITVNVPDSAKKAVIEFPEPIDPGVYRFEVSYQEEDLFLTDTIRALIPDAEAKNVYDLKVGYTNWYRHAKNLPNNLLGKLQQYLIYRDYGSSCINFLSEKNIKHLYNFEDYMGIMLTGQMLSCKQDALEIKNFARYVRYIWPQKNIYILVEVLQSLKRQNVNISPEVLVATGWWSINFGDLEQTDITVYDLEQIWQSWPLAGLLLEQVAYSNLGDNTYSFKPLIDNLGLQGLEKLLYRTNEIPYNWPDGTVCQYSLAECLCRLLRYECICDGVLPRVPGEIMGDSQGINIVCQRSSEELEGMLSLLDINPRGLLHPDFFMWSLFNWLRKIKNVEQEDLVNEWVQEHVESINSILKLISGEDFAINSEIINSVTKRYSKPQGTFTMVNFPYISGVVALAQRVCARQPGNFDLELELSDLAIDICRIYPDLYLRDLCLFEILLSILL